MEILKHNVKNKWNVWWNEMPNVQQSRVNMDEALNGEGIVLGRLRVPNPDPAILRKMLWKEVKKLVLECWLRGDPKTK